MNLPVLPKELRVAAYGAVQQLADPLGFPGPASAGQRFLDTSGVGRRDRDRRRDERCPVDPLRRAVGVGLPLA
jgi:hypothetical protein